MAKAKKEAEIELRRYEIAKDDSDFAYASIALEKISESTATEAKKILEVLKKYCSSQDFKFSLLEKLENISAKIEKNEKEADECENKFIELQQKVDWLINIPEKENEAETPMKKIGQGMHERIVAMYYGWKRYELETKIFTLEEENEKLEYERALLEQEINIIKNFEHLLKSSELGMENERKGAKLIERAFTY